LRYLGTYPRIVGNEVGEIKRVLLSPHWNTASGGANKHKQWESVFAEFVGSEFAVSVASGGVAIQMTLRAAGLKPGGIIAHQVDTCNAVPQAIINAHYSPYFIDASRTSYMLEFEEFAQPSFREVSAILATHLWGYPESVIELSKLSRKSNIPLIEDCCLALGVSVEGKHVGNFGLAGVFSFGATKPLQVGEGGMISTNDRALAEELKNMRNWGERNDSRNLERLGINGRYSEILSAVAIEQLYGYKARMKIIGEQMREFLAIVAKYEQFDSSRMISELERTSSPTRLIVPFSNKHSSEVKISDKYIRKFRKGGIGAYHVNFEPLDTQSFFNTNDWTAWTHSIPDAVVRNNSRKFKNAHFIHHQIGFSLPQSDFSSRSSYKEMVRKFINTMNSEIDK
jgi:dTDP-4-amino-4,6-dideoxygalactose transaminase